MIVQVQLAVTQFFFLLNKNFRLLRTLLTVLLGKDKQFYVGSGAIVKLSVIKQFVFKTVTVWRVVIVTA